MNQPSIFSRIINGEIPCHKVYEDKYTLAFLDIYPVQAGHTLVVPKKQVEFLWDLDQVDYEALMASVKKVGLNLRTALGVPYVGVKVIGTDVPHTHVHLIPFHEGREFYNEPDESGEPDHKALASIAEKLRFS